MSRSISFASGGAISASPCPTAIMMATDGTGAHSTVSQRFEVTRIALAGIRYRSITDHGRMREQPRQDSPRVVCLPAHIGYRERKAGTGWGVWGERPRSPQGAVEYPRA